MGAIGAIPYTEMVAYLRDIAGFTDEDDINDFITLIEFLDAEYLNEQYEKQRQEQNKATTAGAVNSSPKRTTRPPR